MVWFFDRGGQRLRYEIRRTDSGDKYELLIGHPDGHTEVEQLVDPSDLLQRCAELAETLRDDGWKVG